MKKLFLVLMTLMLMVSMLATSASAAPAVLLTQTPELGQLKICKVAGSGVVEGTLFSFRANGNRYNVPAGPSSRNGYCVLAGQYPVGTQVTIEEEIPSGYYVSRIEVKPDRTVSKNTSQGVVTVQIISGVVETIFTNKVLGSPTPTRTPTSVHTSTPRPPTSTPSCAPNCTPTSTPAPTGRLQLCKEAEGPGVSGSFTFRFDDRTRSVPVGACAGLISVRAGTLTITETAQTGYAIADIYTIPADRLISKDLNAGLVNVRIVEGTSASQTIVIFRNRSTTTTVTPTWTPTSTATVTATGSITPTGSFTPTATQTSTATATPTGSITPTITPTTTETVCPPVRIAADFNSVGVGESVEGLGVVAPYLDIQATNPGNPNAEAVRVAQVQAPEIYLAPNNPNPADNVLNGGLIADGGFTDLSTRNLGQAHEYTFTFALGVTVSNFTLHMLDYGDFNPTRSTSHLVTMTGYDINGNAIPASQQTLSYTTPADVNPRTSDLYGDPYFSGDAVWAQGEANAMQPGNWTWNISGNEIARIVLAFPEGHDPRIAFDLLSFAVSELCACQESDTADYFANFSTVGAGQSVEGMGRVAPDLNIDATSPGNPDALAVKVTQAQLPMVYLGPNDAGSRNGGLVADGGFSDVSTRNLPGPHEYTFTFASGVTVANFTLHMLDYGDLNQDEVPNHRVMMVGYDANGNPIPGASQMLSYTSDAVKNPPDLWIPGDAITARLGQPGNYTWNISGTGIARVVLSFPEGYDPNVAFNRLTYRVECQ